MGGHTGGDPLHVVDPLVRVADEIGLGEHDDGRGAGAPRERDEAFDPAQLRLGIEMLDDEHDVDVRGQHLGARGVTRGVPDELAAPGREQHPLRIGLRRSDDDGVTDRGWDRLADDGVEQAARAQSDDRPGTRIRAGRAGLGVGGDEPDTRPFHTPDPPGGRRGHAPSLRPCVWTSPENSGLAASGA